MLTLAAWTATAFLAACSSIEDCLMNGDCVNRECVCDQGWTGDQCQYLDLLPAPEVGAYGYSPNVSSWGGIPVEVNGTWHLNVAEMINGCGLASWTANSRIVHATSAKITGPYVFQDVSLPHWSHNPHVAVDNSSGKPKYLLFHIGNAEENGRPKQCGKETHDTPHPTQTSSLLHVSDTLSGPWAPVDTGLGSVNNPAPFIFPNGTLLLTGNIGLKWSLIRGDTYKGPWTKTPMEGIVVNFQGTYWEDPFIWYDNKRSVYKMVVHAYSDVSHEPICYVDYSLNTSGYAYSKDSRSWVQSHYEPFSGVVPFTDGTSKKFNTRERPKIVFGRNGELLALSSGVGGDPLPWGCKETPGKDWSYTLVQPIRGSY